MKLTYRGHAYEISMPSQSHADAANSTTQIQIKLSYRGQTYYATPCATPGSAIAAKAASAVDSVVTLIYRGVTYKRTVQHQPYRSERAINWRYQVGQ